MQKEETSLPGVYLITPDVHGDSRGYFMETYTALEFAAMGISAIFVQDNESFTAECGTVRGIHFQNNPMAQAKLVRVARGAVMDVAVDLRRGSPTYKKWAAFELDADKKQMLYIPRGFGHGFKTLTPDVVFSYKVDSLYSPNLDRGIRYNDPDIAIDWGTVRTDLLSKKDTSSPFLTGSDCNFVY